MLLELSTCNDMPRKAEGKSSSSVTATTAIPERSPDVRLRIWASQNSTEIVDGCQLLRASLDRVLKEWV